MDKVTKLLRLPLNADGEPYIRDVFKTLGIKWTTQGFTIGLNDTLIDTIRQMVKRIRNG